MMKWLKREQVSRAEVAEEALIAALVLGAAMAAIGIVLSAFAPQGLAAVLAMVGAFVSFVAMALLALFWFIREGFK